VNEFPSESTEEYEINPCLIVILHKKRFAGDDLDEDPYAYLSHDTEIRWTLKLKGYSNDELKLKLFSQSLTNTDLAWYRISPVELISTWEK
jgi:hypothetical protein